MAYHTHILTGNAHNSLETGVVIGLTFLLECARFGEPVCYVGALRKQGVRKETVREWKRYEKETLGIKWAVLITCRKVSKKCVSNQNPQYSNFMCHWCQKWIRNESGMADGCEPVGMPTEWHEDYPRRMKTSQETMWTMKSIGKEKGPQ
jgi:hypothetical protein